MIAKVNALRGLQSASGENLSVLILSSRSFQFCKDREKYNKNHLVQPTFFQYAQQKSRLKRKNTMIKLDCPSCGANLELPDKLDVAHCMYCGGKVILRSEHALTEMVNHKRFSELANFAFEAKDYQEAINYSNRILEIDTQSIDAWLIKAEAIFNLSTATDDKFSIAMEYLSRASKINKADPRITETKAKLTKSYSTWLNNLGLEALKSARQTYKNYATRPAKTAAEVFNNRQIAIKESWNDYRKAMDLFIQASNHDPYNISALENIQIHYKETRAWIHKTPLLEKKIETLHSLQVKYQAQQMLRILQNDLESKKAKLNQLDDKQNMLNKLTRANLEWTISSLEKDISRKQALAAYEPS
jgi:tetratricopeptide (TPR) repeat protein